MSFSKYRVVCSLLTFGIALVAMGADWPQFRGPNRDGVSSEVGLLKKWPSGGLKELWSVTDLGAGHSTLTIQDGRLFTMGDHPEDNTNVLHVRSVKDGKEIWKKKVGKPGGPGWGDFKGPRSTPTADGDRVYALGQYGELVCFLVEDGGEVWRRHYTDDFGGPLPEWGFSDSLLIDGSKLLCMPGGEQGCVVALDKMTGKVLWRSTDFKDKAEYASLIRVVVDGVAQYLALTMSHLAGISVDDGSVLWKAERKGQTAVCATPIYKDNHIYVTSGYGVGCNLFEVRKKDGEFRAKEIYKNKVMVNHHGGAVLVGDHIYGYSDGKGWVCQNFKTGKMKWREKKKLGKGTITYADGCFYLRDEGKTSTIALIEASPDGYKELGRFDQPHHRSDANGWAVPVVLGGRLYLRDQEWLFCFDVRGK